MLPLVGKVEKLLSIVEGDVKATPEERQSEGIKMIKLGAQQCQNYVKAQRDVPYNMQSRKDQIEQMEGHLQETLERAENLLNLLEQKSEILENGTAMKYEQKQKENEQKE
jgi:hypothetical protein